MIKTSKIFTLSSYGPTSYGTGHTIDGKPPKDPAFKETFNPLIDMIKTFKTLPTGTLIKVTMEEIIK
jgi:hypothetical protein